MTENRFEAHIFDDGINERYPDGIIDNENDENVICNYQYISSLLNEQHEENLELKHDNKRLVKFIMSKGYTLKDYLDWLQKEVWK